MYKTRSSVVLNRFEILTSQIMSTMQARKPSVTAFSRSPAQALVNTSSGAEPLLSSGIQQDGGGSNVKKGKKKKPLAKR